MGKAKKDSVKPDNTPRQSLNEWFPNTAKSIASLSITSPRTWKYNCVAWAVGMTDQWLEPSPAGFWPIAHEGNSVDAYVRMFNHYGFQDAEDGSREKGFEKIVLYADDAGVFLHVARQLPAGKWTSKIGRESDVTHTSPDVLTSATYGKPVRYLKRPL